MSTTMCNKTVVVSGAQLSEDRCYRYSLWRYWAPPDVPLSVVNWVMLNPSKADETENDATIGRCLQFAQSWGYNGIVVTNLFALRATDPGELALHAEPIGPLNDLQIGAMAQRSNLVVCAWGAHGTFNDRNRAVVTLLERAESKLHYLTLTKNGQPGHPLRLSSYLTPQPWRYGA